MKNMHIFSLKNDAVTKCLNKNHNYPCQAHIPLSEVMEIESSKIHIDMSICGIFISGNLNIY